jgi:hypothetical protein
MLTDQPRGIAHESGQGADRTTLLRLLGRGPGESDVGLPDATTPATDERWRRRGPGSGGAAPWSLIISSSLSALVSAHVISMPLRNLSTKMRHGVREFSVAGSTQSSRRTGSVNVNVEPAPTRLFTQILPPWSSMNFRESASPSVVPSTFLSAVPTCRNSSKTASCPRGRCRPRYPPQIPRQHHLASGR